MSTSEETRFFVGNIPHAAGELDIARWFEEHNYRVLNTQVVRDRATGHSRGFGFVSVAIAAHDARGLIETLHGKRMMGRVLTVNDAKPRVPKENARP